MKTYKVFIDESGDHNLNIATLDGDYNIFVLVAVIFDEEKYKKYNAVLRRIKKKLRGDDTFILHTAEITRPTKSKDKRNDLFNNPKFRNNFYHKINLFIESMDCTIVTCIINKDKLIQQYGSHAKDPYLLSFENVLNHILRATGGGVCEIYPEKRSHVEDIKLETLLLRLKTMGTAFYSGSELQDRIVNFQFTKKENNESGSQIVDMIATPIGRHYLQKHPKPGHELDYKIIQKKIPTRGKTILP